MNTLQHFGLWDATNGDQGQVLAMVYRYDQLNRLRTARGLVGLGNTNTWDGVNDAATNRYRSEYTYDANGNIESVQRYDGAGTGHYDSFAYHYHTSGGRKKQNRLYELIDAATMNTGSDIVTTATGFDNTPNGVNANNNYGYDALGNLVRDDREDIELIHWTVAGKVDSIQRPGTSSRSPLKFRYGASGQRVSKQVGDFYCTDPGAYREHYIRDAQGNIMATYRYTNTGAASLKLNERPVYGSSRLGSLRTEVELHTLAAFDPASANPVQMVDLNYELTDHLGNVCAVVTGRLLDGNGGGTAKQAELVSAQGYEPFGSLLPGRNYSSDSYRFGFGGMPKDNEVHGATGTSYDFGARLLDVRIGRWLSLDPLAASYPNLSPYVFVANSPLQFIDPDGRRIDRANSVGLKEFRRALLETPTGKSLWKQLKRHPTLVTIIVTEQVLFTPAGNSINPVEGVVGYPTGPNGQPTILYTRDGTAYYATATLNVSLGIFNLKRNAAANQGVAQFEDIPAGAQQGAVQDELANGSYASNLLGFGGIIGSYMTDLVSLSNNAPTDVVVPTPLVDETRAEFIGRVGGHEATHILNDAQTQHNMSPAGTQDKRTLRKNINLEQERKPYQKERQIIDQQKSNRRKGR